MSNSLGVADKTLDSSISSADASTMLLRLAGKQPSKKGETASDQKDKNKGQKGPSGKRDSVVSNDGTDGDDLQDFRELFNMLDQSNTGIITAENLYAELSRVDSEITYEEVEDVLKKVDKDGNGEIDFDEFLVHMTNLGGNLYGDEVGEEDEEQRKKKSRRKEMFYKTITCFSRSKTYPCRYRENNS
ncbi:calmodulin-like [Ruditapes philippinarum]|uniref:calmodulin-like n=1 Tax=Ruditapes philippinarum TaxID=129788 RepID=UPI00295C2FB0|nr:calmodulin-like [Ruditapes philippinarum]